MTAYIPCLPYQLCPKCEGHGVTNKKDGRIYPEAVKCDVCEGDKIIPMQSMEPVVTVNQEAIKIVFPEDIADISEESRRQMEEFCSTGGLNGANLKETQFTLGWRSCYTYLKEKGKLK